MICQIEKKITGFEKKGYFCIDIPPYPNTNQAWPCLGAETWGDWVHSR